MSADSTPTSEATLRVSSGTDAQLIGNRVTFARWNPRCINESQIIIDTVEWEAREGNGWYFRLAKFGHMGLDLRRPETDRIVRVEYPQVQA